MEYLYPPEQSHSFMFCFLLHFYYSHLSVFLWESDVGGGDSGAVARGWAGAWVGVEVGEKHLAGS